MAKDKEQEQPETNPQGISRRNFLVKTAVGAGAVALTTAMSACGSSSSPAVTGNPTTSAWKFGIIADTQWPVADDGNNPNSVALAIANQINQQFIANGVQLVVHVGDLCDTDPLIAGEDTWAIYAQSLYNAGIGFFPLRGNHDDLATIAAELQRIYPQTQNGVHNASVSNLTSGANIPATDLANQPVPAKTNGSTYTIGSNFSSPNPWSTSPSSLAGLSYSFDFNNVRFLLLDQFTPPDSNSKYSMATSISAQQSWITQQLSSRPSGSHAIVFGHKGVIACKHLDTLFSLATGSTATPAYNGPMQDAYIESLANNGVRFYFHGHDHVYDRSLTFTQDGATAHMMEITCSSDSSKFGIPLIPAPAVTYNIADRQTPIRQEVNTVGYYIVTVNGPVVSVDYYSANVYPVPVNASYVQVAPGSSTISEYEIFKTPPNLGFVKRETFGYGLNGQQFVVAQGGAYTVVKDTSPNGTKAQILSGINTNIQTDGSGTTPNTGRPLVNVVSTGWLTKTNPTQGDILNLFGMANFLGSEQTDVYTLSMSFPSNLNPYFVNTLVLATLTSNGAWTNAVNENFGGNKAPILGPWSSSYGLGTYGVNAATNTVWAVLNTNGVFAVVSNV